MVQRNRAWRLAPLAMAAAAWLLLLVLVVHLLAPSATTLRLGEGQRAAVDVRVRPSGRATGIPAPDASR